MHLTALRRLLMSKLAIAVALFAAGPVMAIEPLKPGLNEIEVYYPQANERGVATSVLVEDGDGVIVKTPRAVHVHTRYYSGDKEFQGPIVQAGPTTVVANHPKYGNQLYVDVTLPSGAPLIMHSKWGISYVYPDRRVTLKFARLHKERVTVDYHSGRGTVRKSFDAVRRTTSATTSHFKQSKLVQSLATSTSDAGKMFGGLGGALDSATGSVVDGARKLVTAIPLIGSLKDLQSERPQQQHEALVARLQRQKDNTELPFVRTNR